MRIILFFSALVFLFTMPQLAEADSVTCSNGSCSSSSQNSGPTTICTNGSCGSNHTITVVTPSQPMKTICTQQGNLVNCTSAPCTSGNCFNVGVLPTVPSQNSQPTRSATNPTSTPLPTVPTYNHYYRYAPSLTPTITVSPTAKPTPIKKQLNHKAAKKSSFNILETFDNIFTGLLGLVKRL